MLISSSVWISLNFGTMDSQLRNDASEILKFA